MPAWACFAQDQTGCLDPLSTDVGERLATVEKSDSEQSGHSLCHIETKSDNEESDPNGESPLNRQKHIVVTPNAKQTKTGTS